MIEGLLSINTLLMIPFGLLIGIFFGVLPGFAGGTGMALCLPIAIFMSPLNSMIFLINIYCGAIYGGGVPAILLGIPGTAGAAATVTDGFEMTKRGQYSEALAIQAVSSGFGSIVSIVAFLFLSPFLARAALKFGPPEFFMLVLFGLSIIASIDQRNIFKGLFAGALGIALGTIGVDPIVGRVRMSMGLLYLYDGIPYIPFLLGLFCLARMMELSNEVGIVKAVIDIKPTFKKIFEGMKLTFKYKAELIKGSLIGTFIGALPGAGAAVACFVSYLQAKNASKYPEKFGTGIPEGIIAPETANNATLGGALIPTFVFGIPGSGATAVLLGVMMFVGLRPGPKVFFEQLTLIRTIGVGLLIGSLFIGVFGAFIARYISRIVKLPLNIIIPIAMVTSSVGALVGRQTVFDIGIMCATGAIGYIMTKYKYPLTATVLGLLLGKMAEDNFLQSLIMSRGSYLIFFTRPITIVLWIIILVSLFGPQIIKLYKSYKKTGENTSTQ
ncbi:MAG: C4-dicarboxylate ABC transporter permease [Candidatus Atribacteria bacterium]|nr:MAG: C4-dicarboxylate ABC transporter permease [Candidatus Atribacteria bacterium]